MTPQIKWIHKVDHWIGQYRDIVELDKEYCGLTGRGNQMKLSNEDAITSVFHHDSYGVECTFCINMCNSKRP